MPRYMLDHRHTAAECGSVFAAFKGFDTPLRHRETTSSCHYGGHEIWWEVSAETAGDALCQLPPFVAERTTASPIRSTPIP